MPKSSICIAFRTQNADVGEIPVIIGIIQTVADDKLIADLKAAEVGDVYKRQALFRYCMNLYSAKACETLVKTSRDLLYHHIQHLPWKWHMANPTGDIIQRCTSDVERIKTFFQEQFVSVFRILVLIVLALVCMLLMNWKLALVPIIMFPIIVTYSILFHNSIRDRFTECDEAEGVLSTSCLLYTSRCV